MSTICSLLNGIRSVLSLGSENSLGWGVGSRRVFTDIYQSCSKLIVLAPLALVASALIVGLIAKAIIKTADFIIDDNSKRIKLVKNDKRRNIALASRHNVRSPALRIRSSL